MRVWSEKVVGVVSVISLWVELVPLLSLLHTPHPLPFSPPSPLQLPPGMTQGLMADGGGGWISPNSHSQNNSPRYSPDPGEMVTAGGGASGGVNYPVSSMGMVSESGLLHTCTVHIQWNPL